MNRRKSLILSLALLIVGLCIIGSTIYFVGSTNFNGYWYSAENGHLYEFSDGHIFCKQDYITLDTGENITGFYLAYRNYMEAYIRNVIGTPDIKEPLYLVKNKGEEMLCTDSNGINAIFYRSPIIARQLAAEKEEKKKAEELASVQKFLEEQEKISVAPIVSYDDILQGKYSGQIVKVEAIVSSYTSNTLKTKYDFDLWFWCETKGDYIRTQNFHASTYSFSAADVEALLEVDNGDTLLITLEVPSYNAISSGNFLRFDLVKKGELSDYNISGEQTTTVPPTSTPRASTSDIEVSFVKDRVDGDKLKLKVYVDNKSSEIFTGDIYVYFYTAEGYKKLGSDTILVKKLQPGRQSWANVSIDNYSGTIGLETSFSNVRFVSITAPVSAIDEDRTAKTKESFFWSFDGTSWYGKVEEIQVHTDGTCIVTSSATSDDTNKTIAFAVWQSGETHGVKKVQVVDSEGKLLAVYNYGK